MEREAEREWRQQKKWKRQRQINIKRVMQKRKCFGYRGFRHIVRNYRIKEENKVVIQQPSNRFKLLMRRIINGGVLKKEEEKKIRKQF